MKQEHINIIDKWLEHFINNYKNYNYEVNEANIIRILNKDLYKLFNDYIKSQNIMCQIHTRTISKHLSKKDCVFNNSGRCVKYIKLNYY
jgi:hypothetical protein